MKRKLFSFSCCLVMLLTAIFTSCKQEVPEPTPVDVTAPAEVTVLTITNNNGDAIITWKDPTDKDLFGIEISYVKKAVRNNRAAAPLEGNAVVIAPGKQTATITGLENKATYTFTLKTLDTNGNKSAGVNKDFEAAVNEGGVMNVTLKPAVTEPTNQDFAVIIDIATAGKIKTVKWAKGVQIADYFVEKGTVATVSEGNYSFTADESTIYTVFVQDTDGRREVKTIEIKNIDKDAPSAVTNFKAEYSSFDQQIKLTWTLPADKDIKEIKITDGQNEYIAAKDAVEYVIENIPAVDSGKQYNFTAVVWDEAGNNSNGEKCYVVAAPGNTPVFTSFTIPTCKKAQKGNKIVATVAGANFNATGVTTEKFKLDCTEKTVLTGASVEIIDSDNLKVTLTVPENAGTYTVTISIGKNNKEGTFVVEDSALIGDILLNDGKLVPYTSITKEQKTNAVAVVCGFNANGKTLALGLKQTTLAWAPNGTTGNYTKFTDIICTPSTTKTDAGNTATFTGDTDGSDNWNKICEKDTNAASTAATNYPAFNWVSTYGTTYNLPDVYKEGWYMPSIYELTEYIYKNRAVLNLALNALGDTVATPLTISDSDAYWSSSQHGSYDKYSWKLYFGDAYLYDNSKDDSYLVRSVRAF